MSTLNPHDKAFGDLIDDWVAEAYSAKPHGTSHPIATYVAIKAYEYGKTQSCLQGNHADHH